MILLKSREKLEEQLYIAIVPIISSWISKSMQSKADAVVILSDLMKDHETLIAPGEVDAVKGKIRFGGDHPYYTDHDFPRMDNPLDPAVNEAYIQVRRLEDRLRRLYKRPVKR